jgi:head-tail adaptor
MTKRGPGAGKLINKVIFQKPIEMPNSTGGTYQGWEEATYTCRATFKWLRGGETVQAARLEGRQPVVVTIRASVAARQIRENWRMIDAETAIPYDVRLPPVPTDDWAFLEITAESGVPT